MGKEGRREDADADTPEHKGTVITYASLTLKGKKKENEKKEFRLRHRSG